MRNLKLGLSPEARAERCNFIGGSDANIIMSGDRERIERLALEKIGGIEPEDLSNNLAVQLGSWTEEFNRFWYEKNTGHEVGMVGSVITHDDYPFLRATLDGIVVGLDAVFEAKHVNGFGNIDDVVQRYMPQLHHQMSVTGLRSSILSILVGNSKWEMFAVDYDENYADCVLQAELEFWAFAKHGKDWKDLPVVEAPKPKGALRTVDMTGNNEWGSLAIEWIGTQQAAKRNAAAAKELKELVAPDVGEAAGHGIIIKRSKAGALSIKEVK